MSDKRVPVVNLISMRMHGHARVSGYDRLADFLDARVIHPVVRRRLLRSIINRSFKFVSSLSGSKWYNGVQFFSEFDIARQWFQQSGQVFHFLYGENSYRYLAGLTFAERKNSIICTYHTYSHEFHQVVRDHKHLARIDAIIVVSTMQLEFFSGLVGSERVFYIPHGIDVDYFRPKAKKEGPGIGFRFLFVGRHMRDFETLASAAQILKRWSNNLRLSVVASPKVHGIFDGMDNVELYSGISDERLLGLYQQSDIFVLPLLDCTANNSLLEAMACGLPIVSTDLPGVRDYVNGACALLTPKSNPQALAEAILCLQEEEVSRQRMALASRTRSLDFGWQKVASQVQEVYERVII